MYDEWFSPIITNFFCPYHPRFSFPEFYDRVKARGFILYPGKLTAAENFRISDISQVDAHVMQAVVDNAAGVLCEMGVDSVSPSDETLKQKQVETA